MTDTTNTNNTEKHKSQGNTKPDSRARKWCFTVNNYTSESVQHLKTIFCKDKYILGYEGDTKTPHIQGYVEFKNAKKWKTMKKLIPQNGHFDMCKGSTKQNFEYCSKEGKYDTNMDLVPFKDRVKKMCLKAYDDVEWHDWQKKVLAIIGKQPDGRTIHWFWEDKGNRGKSFLCKYIALTHDVIICEGKHQDIFNQVNQLMEKEKMPKIIICDIPRTCINYVSYTALEKLKNGMLYSGKYEGGMCIFPPPHVICFANTEPYQEALSEDRWSIVQI